VAACDAAGIVLLPAGEAGEAGSFSSSESESSLSESSPAIDGLLSGESGLSGPSSSSSSSFGAPDAVGTNILLVAEACRRTRLGKTVTGDGRRS
jgi:hypothetical protein